MRLWPVAALTLTLALGGGAEAARDAGEMLRAVLGEPFVPGSGASSLGNISSGCLDHGRELLRGLANGTEWAVLMYDASAKVPAGLMAGSGDVMGSYEECVAVSGPSHRFTGRYCTASVTCPDCAVHVASPAARQGDGTSAAAKYLVGLCVPSSCSARDVEEHLDHLLEHWSLQRGARATAEVLPGECHTASSDHPPYLLADYLFLILMAAFAALVITGTGYDIYLRRNTSDDTESSVPTWRTVVVAFSLRSNAPPLFSTARPDNSLACINGIRFLSIAWVVVFHVNAVVYRLPLTNAVQASHFKESWYSMILWNATVVTDSFFLIGGILLAYVFMRDRKKNLPFSIVTFYFHRYIRLTPVYAVVIFFYATMLYHLGSGPLWNQFVKVERRRCVDWWFSNLLYVNNYYANHNTCVVQSWYLATDMQLYWLSPAVLYPLWRWPRAGWAVLVACLLGSVAALTFVTAGFNGLCFRQWNIVSWNLTYTPVYMRAGPYLLGLGLGYLLHSLRKDFTMPKAAVCAGWVTSLLLLATTLFGGYRLKQDDYLYDAAEVTMYEGLHRIVWAAALAWVIFACVTGHGGLVNGILSAGIMLPLGKLSYCVYLCHFAVVYVRTGFTSAPMHITVADVYLEGFVVLLISLVISVVLALTFEIPFMIIDKNLLVKRIAALSESMCKSPLPGPKSTFRLDKPGSMSA